jgi:hypothetical protein
MKKIDFLVKNCSALTSNHHLVGRTKIEERRMSVMAPLSQKITILLLGKKIFRGQFSMKIMRKITFRGKKFEKYTPVY